MTWGSGLFGIALGMLIMFAIVAHSDKIFIWMMKTFKLTNQHKSEYYDEERRIRKFKRRISEELK